MNRFSNGSDDGLSLIRHQASKPVLFFGHLDPWNKLQLNFHQNTKFFIHENTSEKIAAILSRLQRVNSKRSPAIPHESSSTTPNNVVSSPETYMYIPSHQLPIKFPKMRMLSLFCLMLGTVMSTFPRCMRLLRYSMFFILYLLFLFFVFDKHKICNNRPLFRQTVAREYEYFLPPHDSTKGCQIFGHLWGQRIYDNMFGRHVISLWF